MDHFEELTPDVYREIMLNLYEEGAQNRFRNNDYRSFEEWLESKEEDE